MNYSTGTGTSTQLTAHAAVPGLGHALASVETNRRRASVMHARGNTLTHDLARYLVLRTRGYPPIHVKYRAASTVAGTTKLHGTWPCELTSAWPMRSTEVLIFTLSTSNIP